MIKLPSRYQHRRLLGQGGMGQVHLVFDRERGEELALKTFAPAEGADLAEGKFLFKQEFWAMAQFRHPHLVAAYDYGELEDGTPYLTMELVPGRDLESWQQDESAVRAWLPGVAAALAYLHGRGYVHGDLKPENIRLREDGTPKLMDLGLLTRSGRSGGAIRGSLHYLAPEAIRQGAIDGRSDLYGLGAVLYHVLAGRPPFEGDNPITLLRAHLEQAPMPLRMRVPGLSPELEAAVMKLLAKEPAGRYASAGELLAAIGLETEGLGPVGLLGSPLIGREAVQALLVTQPSGVVRLHGAAGLGKTRLLNEARAELQLAGVKTLFAQGLGVEASPYEALKPWLRALSAPGAAERDQHAPVLARVLPELDIEPAPALEGAQERIRLHAAVAALAKANLTAAAWLVDDADALDPASAELLRFLNQQGEGRAWSFLLASAQPEEGAESTELAPLDEAQTLDLARALLGQEALPAGVIERLGVLTGGVPGAIEAVLGHWLRTGALVREAGAWVAGPESAFELPGGLSVALDARFTELGEDARWVGRLAALLGASGDLAWLAALCELPEGRFFAAVADLESAEVLATEGPGFRFVRPAQAQALAASFLKEEAAHLHSRAADWLAARLEHQPEAARHPLGEVLAVANHYLAGTEPLASVPWVVAGVRRALGLHANALAEPLLRRALQLEGLAPADRLVLEGLMAQVHRVMGRIDEAMAIYDETLLPGLRAAEDPGLAGHLVTYGILLQLKSQYPQALASFAEAINRADATGEAATGVRARLYAGRVAFFSGETGAAKTHLASGVRRAEEHQLLTLLTGGLSFYGYVLASTEPERVGEALAMLERAYELSQAVGDLGEAHEALNNQGNVLMAAGRLAEARRAFETCLSLCERMGSPNELIFAHLNLGAVKLELGLLGEAEHHGRLAAELSRKQGRKFPEGFSLALEGLALIHRGELATGVARLDRGLALAREIANKYLELNVLVYWIEAQLHLGRWEAATDGLLKARALAEATHNDEHNPKFDRFEAALALGQQRPDAGERLAALVAAARDKEQALALAHALRWQAEGLVAQGQSESAWHAVQEAQRLAAESELLMLQAELGVLAGRAHAQVEQLTASADHYARALGFARDAGAVIPEIAAQAGLGAVLPAERRARREAIARLQALVAGLDAGEREAFLAWPERRALLAVPESTEGAVPLERLHHLTDLMAAVTAQGDLAEVMSQALAALVEIAGADRGFLLLYAGFEVTEQIFHGMSPEDSDAYSSSLAYQVLWSGEPLFIEDAQAHSELSMQKSVQALELRSVVGLPLFDGQEIIGVMLADSRRINTRFSEADMELAMLLARQVAIAITSARRLGRYKNGYEELERLHRLALATAGAHDLESFLKPVAAEAIALSGADRAFLLVGESLECQAAFDAHGHTMPRHYLDMSLSIPRWVFEHGEPLHLLDAQSDDTFQAQKSVMALGLHTVFAVPVIYAGTTYGVLYLDNQRVIEANPVVLHTLGRLGELVGAYLSRARA